MHHTLLKVILPPFNKEFNSDMVRSASQYIICSHLIRKLVSVDSYLRITGDLADSWQISKDSSQFIFQIRKDAFYSDGSEITAHDIEMTIKRQMNSNQATHFDFSTIRSVSSLGQTLTINLTGPSHNFLYTLNHPEFGVLHPKDYKMPLGRTTLEISSGPFSMEKIEDNHAILKRNSYFQSKINYPKTLEIFGKYTQGNADFIFTVHTDAQLEKYQNNPDYKQVNPHIGFTFWISFVSKNLSLNNRKWLQNVLQIPPSHFSTLAGYWLPAKQLYLPDGFGRLNNSEIIEIWKGIEKYKMPDELPKKINILLYKFFPFNKAIIEKLSEYFDTVNVDVYESMDQFEKLYTKNNYDLFLINNDFSSSDLLENIKVTFSPSRPLIKSDRDREIRRLISAAERALYPEDKAKYLKEIERILLTDASFVPLAYMNVKYFVNKDLDISPWSMLSPEISFWKTEWKK